MNETRMIRDIDIENVENLSREETKQIILNSLETRFDDESDDINGYTLDWGNINDEDVFENMIGHLTNNSFSASDLIAQIVEEEGLTGEYGMYTNIYIYFLRESSADKLVEKIKEYVSGL